MSDLGVTLLRLYRQGRAIPQLPGDDYGRMHFEELGRSLRALGMHGALLGRHASLGQARALLVEVGHGLAALPIDTLVIQPGPASALDRARLARGLDSLDSLRSSARLLLDTACHLQAHIAGEPFPAEQVALIDVADAIIGITYHVPAYTTLAASCYALAVGDALCCLARDLSEPQDPAQAGGDASTVPSSETEGRKG